MVDWIVFGTWPRTVIVIGGPKRGAFATTPRQLRHASIPRSLAICLRLSVVIWPEVSTPSLPVVGSAASLRFASQWLSGSRAWSGTQR
jgi:hypothetical protein